MKKAGACLVLFFAAAQAVDLTTCRCLLCPQEERCACLGDEERRDSGCCGKEGRTESPPRRCVHIVPSSEIVTGETTAGPCPEALSQSVAIPEDGSAHLFNPDVTVLLCPLQGTGPPAHLRHSALLI